VTSGQLNSALRRGRDELARARDAAVAGPLALADLRCAVGATAEISAVLADLADKLALRARVELTGEPDLREVVADLRTLARYMRTARLLLEPAEADLGESDLVA
jgi:hypothetical protein